MGPLLHRWSLAIVSALRQARLQMLWPILQTARQPGTGKRALLPAQRHRCVSTLMFVFCLLFVSQGCAYMSMSQLEMASSVAAASRNTHVGAALCGVVHSDAHGMLHAAPHELSGHEALGE
jgi:hypothetical protein